MWTDPQPPQQLHPCDHSGNCADGHATGLPNANYYNGCHINYDFYQSNATAQQQAQYVVAHNSLGVALELQLYHANQRAVDREVAYHTLLATANRRAQDL